MRGLSHVRKVLLKKLEVKYSLFVDFSSLDINGYSMSWLIAKNNFFFFFRNTM